MYLSLKRGTDPAAGLQQPGSQTPTGRGVSRNVVMLGLTSLFTDISSEMVVAIIPIYLTVTVGWTTIGYGLFDGLFSLVDSVFRLVGGAAADRTRNHKRVAASGYALAAMTRLGLIASTFAAVPVIPFLLAERVGKGIRSAPRDALISLSSARERLGVAFGVHRTLDTVGALLGPVLAFWLLRQLPGSFDAIFVVSLVFAAIGVLVISGLVERRPVERPSSEASASALGLLRAALAARHTSRTAGVAFLLGAVTISDGFIFLILQRQASISLTVFPLLYAASAVVYLVLAIPVGALADRIGRSRVYVAGHVALVALYLALIGSDGFSAWNAALCLLLLGLYYACTDGVLASVVSGESADHLRSSAIASVAVAGSLGRLASSVVFGAAWYAFGLSGPLVAFTAAMTIAVFVAARYLRTEPPMTDPHERPAQTISTVDDLE